MAGNSRPTFTKRQKERARQEKQAEKLQRRAQRKQQKDEPKPAGGQGPVLSYDEEGNPVGLNFDDF